MEGDILEQMGMQEMSSKELKQFFFCKNINVSGKYHEEGSYDGRMSMGMMIVMLVLGFITFFMNLGVIIRTVKILRHGHDNKPAFYFIGNLALSDLAIGLYIIIAFLLHLTNNSDLWQQRTCTLQIGVAVTACQETIFTIMLIAIDKYLYICHALRYHQIVTITRVYVAVVSTWVLSLIIGSLPAMGMLVKWEDTCGRCIFAQVVSKDFAIIFFITAVAFPYAVAVSLYSILLFLALKMQKARYGGSYKISEAGRTSYFRLSFMSKKSSSSSRTLKSTSTRVSISSAASGTSLSKAHRRKMRRQAMQEYKASLPGLEERGDEVSAKLVRFGSTGNGDPKLQLNGAASVDVNTAVHPVRDEELQPSQSVKDSEKSKGEGRGGHADDGSNNRTVITIDDNESKDDKPQIVETDFSPENNHVTDLDLKDTGSKLSKEITIADVNCENRPSTKENASESKNRTHNASTVANSWEDTKGQALPPGISTEEQEQELEAKKAINPPQKQLSSESSKSIRSLPSLTSTEEDDTDEKPNWSLSKYFNRVVTDTKDKVLFLKKCQAVKTVLLIIGSFTVTYVPFVVGSLVYSLEKEKSKPLLHALQSILFCAIVANSLVNPLVYAYGYREFRLRTEKFKGVFATKKKPKL